MSVKCACPGVSRTGCPCDICHGMEAKDVSLEYECACRTAQYIYGKEWGYAGSGMYAPIRR